MGRYCLLCGPVNLTATSLHKFPTNNDTLPLWLKFCKLNENDNVSRVKLCSLHFLPKNFIDARAKSLGGRMALTMGAFPTIRKPVTTVLGAPCETIADTTSSCSTRLDTTSPNLKFVESLDSNSSKRNIDNIEEHETSSKVPIIMGLPNNEFPSPKRRCLETEAKVDCSTPKRAQRHLNFSIKRNKILTAKIKNLQRRNRRLLARIKGLKELVVHLKSNNLLSEDAGDAVMETPDCIKELLSRKIKSNGKYNPQLRTFALTLAFYSSRAYDYVRRKFKKLLPHPSTLRRWYTVINGKPGFSDEAFKALKLRVGNEGNVICNFVIDEMSIREQLQYLPSTDSFCGGVDLGTGQIQSDNGILAKNALVFMAVAINGSWKVPIACFLIKSLNSQERANLLAKCLELLHYVGVKVFSITFDGAPVNLSMCIQMGACFEYNENFKPWFKHPVANNKVFIFLDNCHLIKLVRNTLGDKKMLFNEFNQPIKWEFIVNLHKYQTEQRLHAATKITQKHINFDNNRMSVKLSIQVLSNSVCLALKLLNRNNVNMFQNSLATSEFCKIFNDCFDILNCKSKFANYGCNKPLNSSTYNELFNRSINCINYIENLKDATGVPILKTNRKTGFLGFIMNLHNIFHLKNCIGLDYLLTFKLSQDPLETFFSAIRSRGGFNNNPNAKQFESANKRLLVRHEINYFETSNCLTDHIDILHLSQLKENLNNPICDYEETNAFEPDDDCIEDAGWNLNIYLVNVVEYIAGFVVSKIIKIIDCQICRNNITNGNIGNIKYPLIELKNMGKYIIPGADVVKICKDTEKVIRENKCII